MNVNIWDKEKINSAIKWAEQWEAEKKQIPFPRPFLYQCGWDVEAYQEYSIKLKIDKITPEHKELFLLIKNFIDKSMANIQTLMLMGRINPSAYEVTVREFETFGVSIKEQSSKAKDRYEKLKRQKEQQVNTSGIKLM